MNKALILVDIQNDFLPGGTLAVPFGDEVIEVANRLINSDEFSVVVATQDWHPRNHGSFADNHPMMSPYQTIDLNGIFQVLWPVHCVQDSKGAEFADKLEKSKITKVFTKGTDPTVDSYSGFFDNGYRNATGMGDWLRIRDITNVVVAGLALDFCVKHTAIDAKKLGFEVAVVREGCRAVNISPNDSERALSEMKEIGISII